MSVMVNDKKSPVSNDAQVEGVGESASRDELGPDVLSKMENCLHTQFGFQSFLPGQKEVVEHLLAGHSAAAVFPTGGGKSLCYQLPAQLLPGLTLVVSPLIALMKDQIDALAAKSIAAVRFDSTLTTAEYRDAVNRLRAGDLQLVYVAPERFNNERFRELISQMRISMFAVDEAHCISEWGHAFRPDYLKLARYAKECDAERIFALTATAPPKVLDDICREFEIRPEHAVRTGFYRPNLVLRTTAVEDEDRDHLLVQRIQERPAGATIVYVTLQRTAVQVAGMLVKNGIEARAYHAGIESKTRSEVQDWFLQSKQAVIVATIAFGMGIDKSDIRYVYHYNMAKSMENYSQEIGRAGRDGAESICESLVCGDDVRTLENFVFGDTPDPESVLTLTEDVFSRGNEFGVSLYDLSHKHDIRNLVVRTLLTYLELDGYLAGGTPIYAEYRFKPLANSAKILSNFEGERREFVAALFRSASKAKTWFLLDIQGAITRLNTDRSRIVRAMDFLAEQGWLELKVAKVQHRYRRLKSPENVKELASELFERCLARQEQELARLQNQMELMELDGCQTNALASHFGEERDTACGHCNWCQDQSPIDASPAKFPIIDSELWNRAQEFRKRYPQILASDAAFARFLCGVRTPRLTRAKLTGEALFGALVNVPFDEIIARC